MKSRDERAKAWRWNFYATGMTPEPSGQWVLVSDLPPDVAARHVQPAAPLWHDRDDDDE